MSDFTHPTIDSDAPRWTMSEPDPRWHPAILAEKRNAATWRDSGGPLGCGITAKMLADHTHESWRKHTACGGTIWFGEFDDSEDQRCMCARCGARWKVDGCDA